MLGSTESVLFDIGHEVPFLIGIEDRHTDDASNANAEEGEAELAEVEAVDPRVDKGEDLEEGVVNPVGQRGVYVGEQDRGVLDHDLHGLDDGVPEDGRELQVSLVNFAFSLQVGSASQLAKALSSSTENVLRRCLGEGDEEEDKNWRGQPDDFPQTPSPAIYR